MFVSLVCIERLRTHGMPMDMTMVMRTVQPMSVVRGPKRCRRWAKMGERAAEAIFAEPKLRGLERVA